MKNLRPLLAAVGGYLIRELARLDSWDRRVLDRNVDPYREVPEPGYKLADTESVGKTRKALWASPWDLIADGIRRQYAHEGIELGRSRTPFYTSPLDLIAEDIGSQYKGVGKERKHG